MGTVVTFDIRGVDATRRSAVYRSLAEARRILHRADAVFSTWKPESPMNRLRRDDVDISDVPPEIREVLALCLEAKQSTGGWFDPWALPGGLDPTGLVKGWAATRARRVIEEAGGAGVMVNAGGDITVSGRPDGDDMRRWQVAVRDPWAPMRMIALAEVTGAVATSGTYERGAHVIDPFTGGPAAGVIAATVTGPDLAMADAFATALVAGGDEAVPWAAAAEGYEALMIRSDCSAVVTDGFPLRGATLGACA
jgi:thiamine biosynthesis lipoprotein